MGKIEALYALFQKYPSVTTDSRVVKEGSIFFALKGENFDGNDYAAAALEAGAAVAVVDNPAVAVSDNYFPVDDTLTALQQLAALHRRKLGLTILSITGSNGKTTTKELAGRILAKKYHVAVTEGNLNNHIGVPLTLLRMDRQTRIGIVEMGANHRGEIARLCEIAQPDYGLITNIGQAHLEGFGGPEGVKAGKGELFDYLSEHGSTAIYCADDEILREMIAAHPGLRAVPYSAALLAPGTSGGYVIVSTLNMTINTQLIGDYNLRNIAAAMAIGRLFHVEMQEMAAAIESYIPENNRSQRYDTPYNQLILDAYNANPTSMQAALDYFLKQECSLPKAVILGDMLELGVYSDAEHRLILERLQTAGIPEVYLVGKHFSGLVPPECFSDSREKSHGAKADDTLSTGTHTGMSVENHSSGNGHLIRFHSFTEVEQLAHYLQIHPLRGHYILIKGSRGIRLERIISKL